MSVFQDLWEAFRQQLTERLYEAQMYALASNTGEEFLKRQAAWKAILQLHEDFHTLERTDEEKEANAGNQ